jgi:hypothetical protein
MAHPGSEPAQDPGSSPGQALIRGPGQAWQVLAERGAWLGTRITAEVLGAVEVAGAGL